MHSPVSNETSEHKVCKDMTVTVKAQRFRVNDGPWEKGFEPRKFNKGDVVFCDYGILTKKL